MMTSKHWTVVAIVALVIVLIFTAVNLAGALGRISVLTEQAEVLEVERDAALDSQQQARDSMTIAFEEADVEKAEAAVAVAEAQAEVITQEAAAEAAFRRAQNLAADQPILQRAIEEMRAEAIVTSMAHEEVQRVSAAALLTAQNRIATLERLNTTKDTEIDRVNAAWRAEVSIKDQIIAEQQNVIAPSFFTKLFDMPEVAVFGALIGGGIVCLAAC